MQNDLYGKAWVLNILIQKQKVLLFNNLNNCQFENTSSHRLEHKAAAQCSLNIIHETMIV